MTVQLDVAEATLDIPDIGVTIRTLLACASEGYKLNPKRVWKIRYKNTIVGSVRIKTHNHVPIIPKEEENGEQIIQPVATQ